MYRCFRIPLLLIALFAPSSNAQDAPKITPDVVYGHKDGMALTFDMFTPAKPNGAGILFMVSGGWYSQYTEPKAMVGVFQPLLAKGFTCFAVRHGSAPKYAVPDAVADVRRAVRFIHMKAKDLGVDADRLGVFGGSAGGHLTLMLATTGDEGDKNAKDEVLRHSSKIAVAVSIYPPTDLRGWTTDPPTIIKNAPTLKPPLTFDAKLESAVSPLLHVTEKTVPVLLIHGDKDELVPISHSHNILAALQKAKVPCELVTIEGAAHGFTPQQNRDKVLPNMIGWFEKYLMK